MKAIWRRFLRTINQTFHRSGKPKQSGRKAEFHCFLEELESRLAPSVATTTAVVSLVNGSPAISAAYGTHVTLAATVAPTTGSAAPTLGSVDFVDVSGNIDLGVISTETVSGSSAVFTLVTNVNQLQVLQANGLHSITATYNAGAGFNGSSATLANALGVTPAPLTITATANTKNYDGTTTAAAVPTVAGLVGGDTVTGLAGVYADATVAIGKKISVSAYTVNDGNGGNDYAVTTVTVATGRILAVPGTALLSLQVGAGASVVAAPAAGTIQVFIYFDNNTAAGTSPGSSGGIQGGSFYVIYDPTVLSISETSASLGSDIKLGSVLAGLSSNYSLTTATGFASGVVAIGLNHTGISFVKGDVTGQLIEMDFHVLQPSAAGSTTLVQSSYVDTSGNIHTMNIHDTAGNAYKLNQNTTPYAPLSNLGVLTQTGALAPSQFNPPVTDSTDAAIQLIGNTPTSTGVISSQPTAVYGTPLTFTAMIAPATGANPPAAGSVDFQDGNTDLGTVSTETVSGSNANFALVTTPTQLQVIQNGGVHTITAVYFPGSGFSGSTGTLAGGLQVTPAPLTITAVTNTKTYDSTTTAAAVPTVSGLQGNDSIVGLSEGYDTKNAGVNKTLSVVMSPTFYAGAPLTDPPTGLIGANAMVIDGNDNLYVAAGNTVIKFASGATAPSATLTGLNAANSLAADKSGDLFVSNSGNNTVSEFHPGALTPSATLTGVTNPGPIVVDGNGNLYVANHFNVANQNDTVSEFFPGAMTPSATITTEGLASPTALSVDSNNDLYVANAGNANTQSNVLEFPPGGTNFINASFDSADVTSLIGGGAGYFAAHGKGNGVEDVSFLLGPDRIYGGFNDPVAMAFGGDGLRNGLYVVNNGNNTVSKLDYFGTGAIPPLTGLVNPVALAFDSLGNLYVLNAGSGSTPGFVSKFIPGNINDANGGNNYTVATVSNTTGVINKASLTITATTNTKTADGTASAAATPTVSGLIGGDSVTGLTEVYSNTVAGSSKTLSVNTYTINDGNGGNNYVLTTVNNATGVINIGPFSQFAVSVVGGNTIVAGTMFVFTVQATDAYGNPVPAYSGPVSVTTNVGPADPHGTFPVAGALQISSLGFGFFVGDLATAGTYALTVNAGGFSGTSAPLTIVPAAASYFTVATTPTSLTGSAVNVTVTTRDQFGNVATGYTGTVKLTSTDAAASFASNNYTFTSGPGQDNGVHTFGVTLNTGGNQKVIATDTVSTIPTITGTSAGTTVRGLQVTAFTPTADGFTVAFNKPLVPGDLTLYGSNASTPDDVTMFGDNGVGAIHGTLFIDPSNESLTFKATSSYLKLLNSIHSGDVSVVLPDATYTVKLLSGAGGNGFVDALAAGLDGAANGGHANFVTTFATHYQASATPVLGIPDFARGPDNGTPIRVPNDGAAGIPITLYNAANVTDITFSLMYNPALLNITGTLSTATSDATDAAATLTLLSATSGIATFHYADASAPSATPASPLVLGDIVAVVPSGPGSAALTLYQASEQLQLSRIVINNGSVSGAVSANGVHVNVYFGDVNGDSVLDGLDKLTANSAAVGAATGFSAFPEVDPVIVGDVAGDLALDAGDVSTLDAYVAQLLPTQIPVPPTQLRAGNPAYVSPSSIHSPSAADPTLSLVFQGSVADGAGLERSPDLRVVAVNLDEPHPADSTGLTEATLALTFDPAVLSVTPADITLGDVPSAGSGWQLTSVVDQATGQIGVQLYSATPITATQAGSLVNIAFHVAPNATVQATALQLVSAATPKGRWFGTVLADSQGGLILSPGVDRVDLPTGSGIVSAATSTSPESSGAAGGAGQQVLVDAPAQNNPQETEDTTSLSVGHEDGALDLVAKNIPMGGEIGHVISASVVTNGAAGFPAIIAAPPGSPTFLVGNLPLLNALLLRNSPAQAVADRWSLALARSAEALTDFSPLSQSLDDLIWGGAPALDWLEAPGQSQTLGTDASPTTGTTEQQASDHQQVSRFAGLDRAHGDLADDTGEFGDPRDN